MSISKDLKNIKRQTNGERVAEAIVSAMQTLQSESYQGVDIATEIDTISNTPYGDQLRLAIHDGLKKLHDASSSYSLNVTTLTKEAYDLLDPPEEGVLYGVRSENLIMAESLDYNYKPTGEKEHFYNLGALRLFLNEHTYGRYSVYVGSQIDIDSIPEGYFAGRAALYAIELGSNVETIHSLAFNSATNLKEVIISKGTKIIEEDAFYGCSGISFTVDTEIDGISGFPWGASDSKIRWIG